MIDEAAAVAILEQALAVEHSRGTQPGELVSLEPNRTEPPTTEGEEQPA
jgi:hypothetical protein